MRSSIFCIVFALLHLTLQQDLDAQNPLRAGQRENPNRSESESEHFAFERPTARKRYSGQASSELVSNMTPPKFDRYVEGASFTEIPKNEFDDNRTPINNPSTEIASTNLLAPGANELLSSKNKLLELVMKISLNLAFVLSIAVGIILMSRKWLGNNKINQSERAVGDSLVVRETLKIDSRTLLRLVQWRSNRFLVASDQNGIQSVKALNLSFDQTLQELDDTSATEEKLISQLLAGLNQKQ